jgi:hypothetical protein
MTHRVAKIKSREAGNGAWVRPKQLECAACISNMHVRPIELAVTFRLAYVRGIDVRAHAALAMHIFIICFRFTVHATAMLIACYATVG